MGNDCNVCRFDRVRAILILGMLFLLAACSGSSERESPGPVSQGLNLAGSVGDGPIINADIRVFDAAGELVASGTSNLAAGYQIAVADGAVLPVMVRASGGTDLVTGLPADFELLAVATTSGSLTVNLSPYTTLAVHTAQCAGDLNDASLGTAWRTLDRELNLGWDSLRFEDPMSARVTKDNLAAVVLANEALGEMIRRTELSLAGTTSPLGAGEIVAMLGCDLADGLFDGMGVGVEPRVSATLLVVSIGVRLETLAGALNVAGQDATALLDDALQSVMPGSTASVLNVVAVPQLLEQTRRGLNVIQGLYADDPLFDLAVVVAAATPGTIRTDLTGVLDASASNTLNSLVAQVALADDVALGALTQRLSAVQDASTPLVSLAAEEVVVANGGSTQLSWAVANADQCRASGAAWSGTQPLVGFWTTSALTASSAYTLTCVGLGGVTSETVVIDVAPASPPDPDPAPATTLMLTDLSVDSGNATTLTWSSVNADQCLAGGGWTGPRATSGNASTGALDSTQTFTLTCSGSGGSDTASVTVTVNAQPPPPPPALPTVTLQAAQQLLDAGDATTLTWSSTDASSCLAGGAWTGPRAVAGNASTGTLNTTQTYTLTCSGSGGSDSASITVTVNASPPPAIPTVTLQAAESVLDTGDATTLTWSSTDASSCVAGGAWTGSRAVAGNASTGALDATQTYTLTCSGDGGSDSSSVTVMVNAPPPPPPPPPPSPVPTVTLQAAQPVLDAGETTVLSWSSTDASSCTASGGWTGGRTITGTEVVGPLTANTTFTLSCSGAGGNAIAMIAVAVNGLLNLSWQAPTENVDGSPLTDLAGYRIYYGSVSRDYPQLVDVTDPAATTASLTVIAGSYYVAMTALDSDGNESAYSNEVLKATQ